MSYLSQDSGSRQDETGSRPSSQNYCDEQNGGCHVRPHKTSGDRSRSEEGDVRLIYIMIAQGEGRRIVESSNCIVLKLIAQNLFKTYLTLKFLYLNA